MLGKLNYIKKVLLMLFNKNNKNVLEIGVMLLTGTATIFTGFFSGFLSLVFLFPYALDGDPFAIIAVSVIVTGFIVVHEGLEEIFEVKDGQNVE